MKSKVIVDIDEGRNIDVKLEGDHFSKRTLLQVEKAIRLEYRRKVRMHRRNITLEAQERVAEATKEAEATKKAEETKSLGESKDEVTRTAIPATV